jgi:hypothetical protein
MSVRGRGRRTKVSPPAKKIRTTITQSIIKIAKELLIPTWGKIPEKMMLASITIPMTGYTLKRYMEELGERIDINEILMFTKHVAEINGVKNIDYNHDDIVEFLIENTKVRDDDTYMTYLKRVGVVCISIMLAIFTTSAYIMSLIEQLAKIDRLMSEESEWY